MRYVNFPLPPRRRSGVLESPASVPERRSSRAVSRRVIDTSEYVDPDEVDLDGEEWLMPEDGGEERVRAYTHLNTFNSNSAALNPAHAHCPVSLFKF
jgi:hypothetical protein